MSEQDHTALVRKLYAAFENGDVQTILDHVADNAEWINHGPDTVPYAGSRSGKNQIREFFRIMAETTTGAKVVPGQFIAQGDLVCAIARYTATARNTGAEIDTPVAHIFTIRDGKVARWEGFGDTAKLAQAHTVKTATGR